MVLLSNDTYKLVDVNHTKRYPKYDPFVSTSQVTQVCFTPYPMKDNSKKDWWAVLRMKPRSIIDAPEEDAPFQIDENKNPPNLVNIDLDEDVDIGPEEENDTDDNVEEEVDAIDGGYGEESHVGLLDEDDENVDDDADDYFTESLFM